MKTKILNYRIIVTPDVQTGINKPGFTAVCPILGVADDGDTVEKALRNIKVAIQTYIDSLVEDKIPVPVDQPQNDIVTTTQVTGKAYMKFA